jgi:hypothetical protein
MSGHDIYRPGELAGRLFFTDAGGEETTPDSSIAEVLERKWSS